MTYLHICAESADLDGIMVNNCDSVAISDSDKVCMDQQSKFMLKATTMALVDEKYIKKVTQNTFRKLDTFQHINIKFSKIL